MSVELRRKTFLKLYPDDFNIEKDFEASKLIVAMRNGKPYHYWKKNCNITRDGIYTIRFFDNTYLLKDGKLIELWDKIMDAIDLEVATKSRDKKINNILDDK